MHGHRGLRLHGDCPFRSLAVLITMPNWPQLLSFVGKDIIFYRHCLLETHQDFSLLDLMGSRQMSGYPAFWHHNDTVTTTVWAVAEDILGFMGQVGCA